MGTADKEVLKNAIANMDELDEAEIIQSFSTGALVSEFTRRFLKLQIAVQKFEEINTILGK